MFEWQNNVANGPLLPLNAYAGISNLENPFSSAALGGLNTGITGAGVADAGTRLALRFPDIPAGASVQVPQVVHEFQAIPVAHTISGVMVLTNTDSSGAGPFSPATGILSATNNIAVYEILYASPSTLDVVDVPVTLLNAPPNTTLHVATGFAPFLLPTTAARETSDTLPVPRFIDTAEALCLIGSCINISPNQAPNSGPVNAAIFGDPILSNAQVKLSKAGLPDIIGTATTNVSQIFLTTTFDLTGAPIGPRDIIVTPQNGPPVTYHGLFNVTATSSCAYEVSPLNPTVADAGGSRDLVVTPKPSTCTWGASTSVPWITLPPASNSVTQPYVVNANPDPNRRDGLIVIAGQNVFISQVGACTLNISPTSQSFPANGGSITVNVTAPTVVLAGRPFAWFIYHRINRNFRFGKWFRHAANSPQHRRPAFKHG